LVKIKQRLANITAPELDISFNNSPVRKKTAYSEIILRFFQVKLSGEVVWWFPKDSKYENWVVMDKCSMGYEHPKCSIIEYLDLPKEQLLQYEDKAGLADILKVCDKRIGYNRLKTLELSPAARKIFEARFKRKEKNFSTDKF